MFIYGAVEAERPRDGSAESFGEWHGAEIGRQVERPFTALTRFDLVSVYFWCSCRELVVVHNSRRSNRPRNH